MFVSQNSKSLIHVVAFPAGRCELVRTRTRVYTHTNTLILSTLKLPVVSQLSPHYPKWKETEWHSWSSCLQDSITGVYHHTWFMQGWGSSPGHEPCQANTQPAPAQISMFLSRLSLCNPGQPRTCSIDFVAGLKPLKACLPLPPISPSTGEFYINLKGNRFLFAYFIVYSITVFYFDCYYLSIMRRILWSICLTLWQSVTNQFS